MAVPLGKLDVATKSTAAGAPDEVEIVKSAPSTTLGAPYTRGKRPSGLPFLTELLRGRQRDSYNIRQRQRHPLSRNHSIVSPAEDTVVTVPKTYLMIGELTKTSRSKSDDLVHGQSRTRKFRLTENSLEYYHQFFNQVRVNRSFPLTSIESIEPVSGNPRAFKISFMKMVMELEAPTVEEAEEWQKKIKEAWLLWQVDVESDLETHDEQEEDEHEEDNLMIEEVEVQKPSSQDDNISLQKHHLVPEIEYLPSASHSSHWPPRSVDSSPAPCVPSRSDVLCASSPAPRAPSRSIDWGDSSPAPRAPSRSVDWGDSSPAPRAPPRSVDWGDSSPAPRVPPRSVELCASPLSHSLVDSVSPTPYSPLNDTSHSPAPSPSPSPPPPSPPLPPPSPPPPSSSPLKPPNTQKQQSSPFRRRRAVMQRPSALQLSEDGRPRCSSMGQLRSMSSEEDWTGTYGHWKRERNSLRRKLRLVPKLQKQAAVVARTPPEEEHFKLLHEDYAIIKYPRHHWWSIPSEKIFRLDRDNLLIMWRKNEASRLRLKSTLRVDSILEVRHGQCTDRFEKFPYDEVCHQSFSLLYEGIKGKYARLESLDLINDHPKHHSEWIDGLHSLNIGPQTSMFPTRYENTDPCLIWLKQFWTTCNVSHEMHERESRQIYQKIFPTLLSERASDVLQLAYEHQQEATFARGRTLRWSGFVLYYNLLCGEVGPLYSLFRNYAETHGRLGLTLDEFKKFLMLECHWTKKECDTQILRQLMEFHDHHHGGFKKYVSGNKPKQWRLTANLLSYAGFLSFLRSKHNATVNPVHNTVYQDMSQPMSHYFINSSHNTYLEGDQVKGRSSLDAYVRALLHGSRCIEIDVWDSAIGKEPLIYHGYTFTSKLQLRDVVETIKDYAFRMSHYPLIISIENHCSVSQQAKMVSIFKEVFMDTLGQSMLATENIMDTLDKEENEYRLPSPLQLQGKILLKASCKHELGTGKQLKPKTSRPVMSSLSLTSASPTSSASLKPPRKHNGASSKSGVNETDSPFNRHGSGRLRRGNTRREARHYIKAIQDSHGKVELEEDDQELTYAETADNLRELIIYCRSTSIKPWSWVKQRKTSVCQMFSFSELSAERVIRSSKEMLACSERQFVRVYPRGARFDSSNYNPMPFWNLGIHMVALNYQYPDLFMHLNQGRFRQNGGCGYVLKPAVMRRPNPGDGPYAFDPNMSTPHPQVPICNLEIELLSGQNLGPFGKKCSSISVQIATYGIAEDTVEMYPKAETDDGFWPQWETGKYKLYKGILMPPLCLVYFRVDVTLQRLGSTQLFGQNCIALPSLISGIKFIQLRKSSGELIPESGLFVRITKKNETNIISPSEDHPHVTSLDAYFAGVALTQRMPSRSASQSPTSQEDESLPLNDSHDLRQLYQLKRDLSLSPTHDGQLETLQEEEKSLANGLHGSRAHANGVHSNSLHSNGLQSNGMLEHRHEEEGAGDDGALVVEAVIEPQ